jgi:hypothetical protein
MQPLAYNRRDSLINPDFIACGAPAGNWREALAAQSARTA